MIITEIFGGGVDDDDDVETVTELSYIAHKTNAHGRREVGVKPGTGLLWR